MLGGGKGRTMTGKKRLKKITAGILAAVTAAASVGIPFPMPSQASEIWPQKATEPFYCIDGGKGWRQVDRYENYKYDSLPSPLSETQAKRLFWAYPKNWSMLKLAAQVHDPELYAEIASTYSGANIVKRVKDDGGTKFARVADNPEIEARAIEAIEQMSSEGAEGGKEAPDPIREATSEETAVPFEVLPFSDGPGALDTEFVLGEDFIRDIASIEPQSVWDNGSTGGAVGWLDASQDKNIAKSAMGEELYEVTWSGDSIKIRNNGSAVANDNAVGSDMSEEEKYNKTTVRYKITMRQDSGWYTEGSWNEDYLHEWMDFKACVNAPEHQRLYKADIQIVPSDMVFYIVISQQGGDVPEIPGETVKKPELSFNVFRHEETFESHYNVRLKKYDDETGMPLKGSQFYLYERFEDGEKLGEDQRDGGLAEENLSFLPWDGFQIFYEGTTDEDGMISYGDTRQYVYSKTYCDGHPAPQWAQIPEEPSEEGGEGSEDSGGSDSGDSDSGDGFGAGEEDGSAEDSGAAEQTRDYNRAAAAQWLEWVQACEAEQEQSDSHFHWMLDEGLIDEVASVLESGEPGGGASGESGEPGEDGDSETGSTNPVSKEEAFEASGCKADCEKTYENFIHLRVTYTWKEIQARTGYILHGLHRDDVPIEMVTTVSSEAGAVSSRLEGSSEEIEENIWYMGSRGVSESMETLERRQEERAAAARQHSAAESLGIWRFRADKAEAEAIQETEAQEAETIQKSGDQETGDKKPGDRQETEMISPQSPSNSVRDVFSSSNAKEESQGERTATASNAAYRRMAFSMRMQEREMSDEGWDLGSGAESFESIFNGAQEDGIQHLEIGDPDRYSHCGGEEDCGDAWRVYDHRTEGRLHINKRSLDLYQKESEHYSAYGDAEGDATLEGAVYGLFAAENILHPDSDVGTGGNWTNTGIVYQKDDLVATAATDKNGDADFLVYTQAPGMTYDYEQGRIRKRTDRPWEGPKNRYEENQEENGNYWIGRPLILGSYYVKELSRSEGFELSVNGLQQERTNYGAGLETPESVSAAGGTAVLALPELSASMEGEDGGGTGYDQLNFSVTSSGTADADLENGGYDILISGFPEGIEVYRVDTGEEEVTGPHVTGTEEVIVRDEAGNIVWTKAESDHSNIRYEPEYDSEGNMIGQNPVSAIEPQIRRAEQIPEQTGLTITDFHFDLGEEILAQPAVNFPFDGEEDLAYRTS